LTMMYFQEATCMSISYESCKGIIFLQPSLVIQSWVNGHAE